MKGKGRHYHNPVFYAWDYPAIKNIGKRCGYGIALLGSMRKDLDLVAIPWIEDAAEPEVLVERIRKHIKGFVPDQIINSKPHGILSYIIQYPTYQRQFDIFYIDLKIVPMKK